MKFNSQICTTRVQGERLLALGLKKETADMCWTLRDSDREGNEYSVEYMSIGPGKYHLMHPDWYTPAWSLHRLKCLLPEKTPFGDGYLTVEVINENVYIVLVMENVEQRVLKYTVGNLYDNLISCINFFVKERFFNKEYLEEL